MSSPVAGYKEPSTLLLNNNKNCQIDQKFDLTTGHSFVFSTTGAVSRHTVEQCSAMIKKNPCSIFLRRSAVH